MTHSRPLSADDIYKDFDRCVQKLQQSNSVKLNYLETAVCILRTLPQDPAIIKSMNLEQNMEVLNSIFETLPNKKKLISRGWTKEDIEDIEDAKVYFKQLWSLVCNKETAGKFKASNRTVDQAGNQLQNKKKKTETARAGKKKSTKGNDVATNLSNNANANRCFTMSSSEEFSDENESIETVAGPSRTTRGISAMEKSSNTPGENHVTARESRYKRRHAQIAMLTV